MPATDAALKMDRKNASSNKEKRQSRFIHPTALMHIKSLELRARTIVEGFWNGLHRSPFHGFSVEFSEYRQYSPGDDLRYLDWRLFARSDRYYVKRFEEETNLRCHLLVDLSHSMSFGTLPFSKADYAKTLAATFAYFLSTQRDAAGLITFAAKLEEMIPARYRPGHLRRIMLALEKPTSGTATDLISPLEQVASTVNKRGMLILISDLLASVDSLETKLGYLRARGHEVILFQILDPAEVAFNFEKPAFFEDVESGKEIYVDPDSIRKSYQENLENHIAGIRTSCDKLGIAYHKFTTDTPLELAFVEFMTSRMNGRKAVSRRQGNIGRRPA